MSREPSPGAAGPIIKGFRAGTHRLIPPAQTVERLRPLLPALGITRIANITGLDVIGIPVVVVCRPNARSLAVSQGKGLDLEAARASGLMESVEMFHAERLDLPLRLASYRELALGRPVVDPRSLPRLSYSAWNEDLRLLWIEGEDLLSGERLWLPHEMVHMDYTLPFPPGSGSFFMSSNGLASGNHLLEALSHGLCEVVERDAVSVWRASPVEVRRRTRLALGSIDDVACVRALEHYERAGVAVAVWDITSDLGIPAFRCTIVDRAPDPGRPLYATTGMGCHPTREVALLRSLTEAAQSRLTLISSSRDDVPRGDYEISQSLEEQERLRAELEAEPTVRRLEEVMSFESERFEDDLAWLLGRLRGAGIERVLAVDLSRPGMPVAVARVVIPGLEPYYPVPGYVPGPRARQAACGENLGAS